MPARQTILLAVAVLALTLWLFPTRQGIGNACDLVRFPVKTQGLVLDSVNAGSCRTATSTRSTGNGGKRQVDQYPISGASLNRNEVVNVYNAASNPNASTIGEATLGLIAFAVGPHLKESTMGARFF